MLPHADYARRAAAAYVDAPEWRAGGNIRALLDRIDGVPVISVPGTDPHDPLDVLTDLDCDPHFMSGLGFVHHGFARRANALWPLIYETLFHDRERLPRVTVLGHSLGGAVGMLLAGKIKALGLADRVELVTFGCPKVGAQLLAVALLGVEVTLYRFGGDPVPLVPVPWLLHLPPVFYAHPRALTSLGAPRSPHVEDHAITNYATALDRAGL